MTDTPARPSDEMTIDELSRQGFLSVRTHGCLKNDQVETLGELRRTSLDWLSMLPNFGKDSLAEVRHVLEADDDVLTSSRYFNDDATIDEVYESGAFSPHALRVLKRCDYATVGDIRRDLPENVLGSLDKRVLREVCRAVHHTGGRTVPGYLDDDMTVEELHASGYISTGTLSALKRETAYHEDEDFEYAPFHLSLKTVGDLRAADPDRLHRLERIGVKGFRELFRAIGAGHTPGACGGAQSGARRAGLEPTMPDTGTISPDTTTEELRERGLISTRTYNGLRTAVHGDNARRYGPFWTVGELMVPTTADLLRKPNFGYSCFLEVWRIREPALFGEGTIGRAWLERQLHGVDLKIIFTLIQEGHADIGDLIATPERDLAGLAKQLGLRPMSLRAIIHRLMPAHAPPRQIEAHGTTYVRIDLVQQGGHDQ